MPHLFERIELRGVTSRNRIVVSPMMQYSTPDGLAGDWHLVHLGSRAIGGAGIVIQECTMVSPRARATTYDLGLWNDAQRDALAPIVAFVRDQGAVMGIQIGHMGRKSSSGRPWDPPTPPGAEEGGWIPEAPSAIPFAEGRRVPQEMSAADVRRVIEDFGQAAGRARDAGYQLIELHGAHGYLVNSFLSPLSNHRNDEYGKDLPRFLIEVAEEVREQVPNDFPLGVRLSVSDGFQGGRTLQDTLDLVPRLRDSGIDFIDCSSGGIVPRTNPWTHEGHIDYARQVRERGIPTIAVAGISDPHQADHIIRTEQADLVALGRELLRDAYWAAHAAKVLDQDVPHPVQYSRAWR